MTVLFISWSYLILVKGDYTTEQFKYVKLEVKWLMATIDDYQLKRKHDNFFAFLK